MIDYIKLICSGLIDNFDFSDAVIGEVVSVNPLSFKISDKLIIGENQTELSRNVMDYIEEATDNPMYPDDVSNDEDFKRRIKRIVYNRLNVGETVILIKSFGGQRYFVLDRVRSGGNDI